MKLNLGSGKKNLKDYINIDAVKQTDETVIGDILNLNYKDNSIDKIYIEHVIEHLTKPELDRLFSECKRMLKSGGELIMIAPCLTSIIEKYNNGEIELWRLDNYLYARHLHDYDYHKQGIYKEKLEMYCNKYNITIKDIYYNDNWNNEIVLEAIC